MIYLQRETVWDIDRNHFLSFLVRYCKSNIQNVCLSSSPPSLYLFCLLSATPLLPSFTWISFFSSLSTRCPPFCLSPPPLILRITWTASLSVSSRPALLCRSRRLSQPPKRWLFPGPGVSGEMSMWRHRSWLLQSQTGPRTSAHPRAHYRPVSWLEFPFVFSPFSVHTHTHAHTHSVYDKRFKRL